MITASCTEKKLDVTNKAGHEVKTFHTLDPLKRSCFDYEMKNVIISTGSLNYQYVVLDCIFAFDHAEERFMAGTDRHQAFEGVKQ